jgi:hypothetical protein
MMCQQDGCTRKGDLACTIGVTRKVLCIEHQAKYRLSMNCGGRTVIVHHGVDLDDWSRPAPRRAALASETPTYEIATVAEPVAAAEPTPAPAAAPVAEKRPVKAAPAKPTAPKPSAAPAPVAVKEEETVEVVQASADDEEAFAPFEFKGVKYWKNGLQYVYKKTSDGGFGDYAGRYDVPKRKIDATVPEPPAE